MLSDKQAGESQELLNCKQYWEEQEELSANIRL